jgi:type II secretory pathway component PulM
MSQAIAKALTEHRTLLAAVEAMAPDIERAAACIAGSLRNGGTVYW